MLLVDDKQLQWAWFLPRGNCLCSSFYLFRLDDVRSRHFSDFINIQTPSFLGFLLRLRMARGHINQHQFSTGFYKAELFHGTISPGIENNVRLLRIASLCSLNNFSRHVLTCQLSKNYTFLRGLTSLSSWSSIPLGRFSLAAYNYQYNFCNNFPFHLPWTWTLYSCFPQHMKNGLCNIVSFVTIILLCNETLVLNLELGKSKPSPMWPRGSNVQSYSAWLNVTTLVHLR